MITQKDIQHMLDYVKIYLEKSRMELDKKTNCEGLEKIKQYPYRDRFQHTLRVYKMSLKLAEEEGADKEVIIIASIFHDIGKFCDNEEEHGEVGSKICESYLRDRGYNEALIERVTDIIKKHSLKDTKEQLSLEHKIVMDADILDELGALSCALDAMTVVRTDPAPSFYKVYEKTSMYYQKYTNKKHLVKTKSGMNVLLSRLDFIHRYLEALKNELFLDVTTDKNEA